MDQFTENATPLGLYDPQFEHDACGIGAVVDIKGRKSHQTVSDALSIVERLEHRAGKDAEGKTGDGVGIMLQISHKFFSKVADELNISLGNEREYGVGMFFFPQNEHLRAQAMKLFELVTRKEGLEFLAWRAVPVDPDAVGQKARDCMPSIWQCFIKKPARVSKGIDFDRRLYIIRRVFEQASNGTYVPSLSSRTIVYKGMFLVHDLRLFYLDLQDEDYESAIGMVHSRFSTNTNPSWMRAHPNRFILHNGEINTIKGNTDAMLAREETISSPIMKEDMNKILPIINTSGSDSAMLDNALEFMVMNGMDLPLAVMITIPEPWENNKNISQKKRDFYQYYATMLEPWDGPAAILFSDGDVVGAVLDRNGLRPSRYYITKDGRMILSSEVGVLPCAPDNILMKDRLRPGKMLLVDTVKGEVVDDEKLKEYYASREPYGEWIDRNLVRLKDLKIPNIKVPSYTGEELTRLQKVFGYKYEEIKELILPMARAGAEPSGAMGTDTPLAVLSDQHPPLFNYFKQRFAQVTNPPIDAIREKVVTSTSVYVGAHGNLLEDKPENCKVLKVQNPILTSTDLLKIKHMNVPGFKTATVSINYYKNTSLEKAIDRVFLEVDRAYKDGANIIILSDRDIDEYHVSIPSLLAVSAVSQYLIRTKKSTAMALILESAEPHEVHHFATLLGYGACAVNPYLAHDTIAQLIDEGLLDKDYYAAVDDYNKAVLNGIVKIASKMGISTIASYRCSKLFEAVGLHDDVVGLCFQGAVSRIGGASFEDFQQDLLNLSKRAWLARKPISQGGLLKYVHGGEYHAYNPDVVRTLQQAVQSGEYSDYQEYAKLVNERPATTLRDLLAITPGENAVNIADVEPASELFKRFDTAAMSIGALSPEAHEALAEAMNSIGGNSNSGEGGEDPARYGTNKVSRIKQVASGRFGVTPAYLVNADVIQIKVAQGAKPGEGGQLPGDKVTPYIAKLRYSVPGVTLISPPPHHDIYSIEDLAQLIFDLKQVNPKAMISVKLVSEPGVGTIATGVAKAYADLITIAGYDGGTGASPLSSVKYAGCPWELGLVETQQALVANGLRHKIRLQVDGGLKTGVDIIKAAILGAESFGFGTGPMVALGCKYLRICHLNNCATGVATQDDKLRKNHYHGLPFKVTNYFEFIARETRELMAQLGVTRLVDLIGRTDLLKELDGFTAKQQKLALSKLLETAEPHPGKALYCTENNPPFDNGLLNAQLLQQAKPFVDERQSKTFWFDIRNTDRSVGASLSGYIAQTHGDQGLAADPIKAYFNGTAGQSFGVWNAGGVELYLTGDANDYVGKGMAGGLIAIRPPVGSAFRSHEASIIGNTCLYGATGGRLYAAGRAGERFGVRNSGAITVVEGIGDNGCEYMTGGIVCILGKTGVNFGAGMTGGFAYVLDESGDFRKRVNPELVEVLSVDDLAIHEEHLRGLITEHVQHTGSQRGEEILANWSTFATKFALVKPKSSDVKALLGHRSRSAAELRVQAQ